MDWLWVALNKAGFRLAKWSYNRFAEGKPSRSIDEDWPVWYPIKDQKVYPT